jgi:hypothetical protein
MLSFVVCSVDAGKFAAFRRSLAACAGGDDVEVVGVHDARSLCGGWTDGLRRAKGDPVVFCHDDIGFFMADLPTRILP